MAPPPCETLNAQDWMLTLPELSSVSDTTTLVAADGPRLSTKIVYVNTCPTWMLGDPTTNFDTCRSASSSTRNSDVAMLFDMFGSGVSATTRVVLMTSTAWFATIL